MIIYLIENTVNHKIYIGQTIGTLFGRKRIHKYASRTNTNKSPYLYNAMRKYGFENFEFNVLDDTAKTQEQLDKFEIWWIDFFKSTNRDIGYNIEKGGNGKGRITNETRARMAKSKIGNKNRAVITMELANQIREEYKTTKTSWVKLSKKYGICKASIGDVINYKSWRI